MQLAIRYPVVTVQCVARERVDERTGKPFRWQLRLVADVAADMVSKVRRGEQRDPFGKPWPPTDAWIREGGDDA